MLNKTSVHVSDTDTSEKQIELFLSNVKKDPRYVYLHIPAVNAGEYYGPNNWGDYFPEDSLKETYQTFYNAKVYRRHKNKDPRKSLGDVVLAVYNHKRHRVELIVKIYRDLAPDIGEAADKGEPVGFSMGCRVPFEECSICHKKFSKTINRCEHLSQSMNKFIDGKQVYAINRHPVFFDISETPNPADKMVWSIQKVASEEMVEERELLDFSDNDKLIGFKVLSDVYFEPLMETYKTADKGTLDELSQYPLNNVIVSSLCSGTFLKPEEFQYLYVAGENEKLAERFLEDGIDFRDLPKISEFTAEDYEKIAADIPLQVDANTPYPIISETISNRHPYTGPLDQILNMVKKEVSPKKKESKELPPYPALLEILLKAGLLYGGYRMLAANVPQPTIKQMAQAPALKNVIAPVMAVRVAESTQPKDYSMDKYSSWVKHALVGLGGSYAMSSKAHMDHARGKEVSGTMRFVAENPLISSIGIGVLSGKAGSLIKKSKKSKNIKQAEAAYPTDLGGEFDLLEELYNNNSHSLSADADLLSSISEQLKTVLNFNN